MGLFKNRVLVVTGSVSLKVKKHAVLFPGRKGKGKTVKVLPLSFPECVKLFNAKKLSEIKHLFEKHKATGGFLGALENEKAFMKEMLEAIKSEISKLGLREKLVFQITASLLEKFFLLYRIRA